MPCCLNMRRGLAACILAALILVAAAAPARAQYFGRNKVQYERFQFEVLSTDHFDIHFYPQEEQAARDLGRMAERWYDRYVAALEHAPKERKPIILYANHADFQQTNVLEGFLGEGTGGVTESAKSRIVLPLTGDYASTDHVLGHELVHVFQYDVAQDRGDSLMFRMERMPLWLIEGMAEYLSVGRRDPNTAMWLRDAVLQDDFPTIKQLTTDSKYFPYRYGQALWAYVGGRWGDDTVRKIFYAAGRRNIEYAFARYTGMGPDTLSKAWAEDTRRAYRLDLVGRTPPDSAGVKVLAPDLDGGTVNLAPMLSPDGSRVAFLSERDLFSIDLFVADARTGKVLKRLTSSATDAHYDALRFIDSAGSWSPDGRRFAFVVFADGDNEIMVVDAESGKVRQRIRAPHVGGIATPAWSPDGSSIVFSGTAGGISDLYLVDLQTEDIRKITEGREAELSPAWSPDGRTLAFVTDRGPGTDFEKLTYEKMRIGLMDMASGEIRTLAPFPGAKHIDPQFSPDGRSLYFISDRDGFSDIYRMNLSGEEIRRVTRLATGVSGISDLSPAISVSRGTGRILFSVFAKAEYNVFGLDGDAAQGVPLAESDTLLARASRHEQAKIDSLAEALVEARKARADSLVAAGAVPDSSTVAVTVLARPARPPRGKQPGMGIPGMADSLFTWSKARSDSDYVAGPVPAGILPPDVSAPRSFIDRYLGDPATGLPTQPDFTTNRYKPSIKLDYVGAVSAGVAVDRFGASIGGGVSAYFSDMLGNHVVGAAVAANGGIKDIGAEVTYLNRVRRWSWGGIAGHVPYLSYYTGIQDTMVTVGDHTEPGYKVYDVKERIFSDEVSLVGFYPFNSTRRVEASVGYTYLSFSREAQTQVQLADGTPVTDVREENLSAPSGVSLIRPTVALVHDSSFFGFTSPINGSRSRFEYSPTFGTLHYQTVLADYRRYQFLNPVTVAFRALHVGRYGSDSGSDRLNPLFLGYESLVRGYRSGSFQVSECPFGENCAVFDRLEGSRIGVVNLEVRIPVLGTKNYGLFNFPYIPTELSGFVDGGVAWWQDDPQGMDLELKWARSAEGRIPVFSTGVAARFNILGALILQGYYAYPFQRPERGGHFGLFISPGW
jgi:Tol biopolymer transport system component